MIGKQKGITHQVLISQFQTLRDKLCDAYVCSTRLLAVAFRAGVIVTCHTCLVLENEPAFR
jgi:hypothetical protein